jgi:DNA modification methylase
MINSIFNADCFDVLKNIEKQSIDLILIDPPYGVITPEWDKKVDFVPL